MKVLKFYAEWCAPCKMLSALMEQMDLPIEVESVDIDENREVATQYGVRGVPTMVLVDDEGTAIETLVGAHNKARLEEFFTR